MGAESYRETREDLVERKQLLREITVQPSVQHYTFKITQWLPPQSTEQRLLTRQDHELQARNLQSPRNWRLFSFSIGMYNIFVSWDRPLITVFPHTSGSFLSERWSLRNSQRNWVFQSRPHLKTLIVKGCGLSGPLVHIYSCCPKSVVCIRYQFYRPSLTLKINYSGKSASKRNSALEFVQQVIVDEDRITSILACSFCLKRISINT